MTDPLSLIALGAGIGGAAGKFVEKAWDSGEKWLASYFANHREKAQEAARTNAAEFLNELATRIKMLESIQSVKQDDIETAQDHPDFSAALQKALLSSAQTDNKEKHQLLARLISERIKTGPESLLSLASKMACDAISYTSSQQLRVLGLQSILLYIKPSSPLPNDQFNNWLVARLDPYKQLDIKILDYLHLEALSCAKHESFLDRDLLGVLKEKNNGNFDNEAFFKSDVGIRITFLWNEQLLRSLVLTSIGQIIGVYVSDMLSGGTTQFQGWS